MMVTRNSIPALRRGVRRQFDAARNGPVLMAPERVVMLDEIADAIILECDGRRSIGEICDALARKFTAPAEEISGDVLGLFEELVAASLVSV